MGFAIGMSEQKLEEKGVKGSYRKVAVLCWFTSNGKSFPQLIKYEDEDGLRHTVSDIGVKNTEKKYYAGVLLQKYDCCVLDNGVVKEFILLYHPEEGIWDMVLPDE